ncbi:hypothetical protein Poli38472_003517 [Pythium oligandrum]|uniref:Proline-rich protein PRCC n=1 Tax=Pythium oligandrum TaxID=41045 RepID=A0A8K1C6S3_PYTOL|nr:hypothetical protein Poli38472_003517 [Pythium oligandrum]|eukprot:TMW57592.1 hypothetical protein Poli38472_003517 [Pythium oligandrum]
MSLLVPDYSSSSDDEEAPRVTKTSVAKSPVSAASNEVSTAAPRAETVTKSPSEPKPRKSKKTKKGKKTTLFLPPEIQKLLETGTFEDSDDDLDGDHLLAKHRRAAAKRPRPETKSSTPLEKTSLSFLPAPKHQLDEPTQVVRPEAPAVSVESVQTPATESGEVPAYDAAAYEQYYYQQQQYAQYYQQQGAYDYPEASGEAEEQGSSKRARHLDRELERMLQQGQFASVADKIVEVQGPAPNAWQAPVDQNKGNPSEMKLKASFWNTSAGGTVASAKPSRLQRQKHQLNQLAFDAKAREFELLDRKGSSIKTKRETHAKYGW